MSIFPKLLAENCIDMQTQCFVRFVYGRVDKFNPHCHDFFEVFIVAKGTVPHMVKGVIQNLPEGSLVLIRPDDVHSHRCEDPDTAFINLNFTREIAESLFAYLFDEERAKEMLYCDMPPMVLLDKANKKRIVSQISELNTKNWKEKDALKIRMKIILVSVLSFFANPVSAEEKEDLPLWLIELTNKMEQPENFIVGTNRMIALSTKSREHLLRSFKKYYGITITDYINNLRVNYASNLLINTNFPIIDICYNSGFQSVSYFNRVFKAKNGISPNAFRVSHKK